MPEHELEWEVPDYLSNIYALWTLVADALQTLSAAHVGAHASMKGYLDPETEAEVPADTLLSVLLDRVITIEDEDAPLHDLMVAGANAINLVLVEIVDHLREMDSLPPWWPEIEERHAEE